MKPTRLPSKSRAKDRATTVEKERAFRVSKVKPKTLIVTGATVTAVAQQSLSKKESTASAAKLKPNLNAVRLPEISHRSAAKAETQIRSRNKPEDKPQVQSVARMTKVGKPVFAARQGPLYRYSVGPGNNPAIAQAAISARPWWAPGSPTQFYWRARFEVSYDLFNGGKEKKLINRFEKFYELHEKDNMFRNMWYLCTRKGIDLFDIVALTFSFRLQECNFFDDLQLFAQIYKALQAGKHPSEIKPLEVYTDKFGVQHNVYHKFNLPIADRRMIPVSAGKFKNLSPTVPVPCGEVFGKSLWMLKPSWMSRGRGLELFKSLDELEGFIQSYLQGYAARDYSNLGYSDKDERSPALNLQNIEKQRTGGIPKTTTFPTFVIQKYMEKPLLYKGYKFDIRMYVCLNQDYELFYFKESYVRLSSYPYTLDKMNYYIHLTNNAVQSSAPNFNTLVDGNIISIRELERYTREKNPILREGDFMHQIAKIVRVVFDATYDILNPKGREHCFELFGLDFMVDEKLKMWLIEVNSGPSLSESNKYLSTLLHRMMGRLV